jgi:hypothetical protein
MSLATKSVKIPIGATQINMRMRKCCAPGSRCETLVKDMIRTSKIVGQERLLLIVNPSERSCFPFA